MEMGDILNATCIILFALSISVLLSHILFRSWNVFSFHVCFPSLILFSLKLSKLLSLFLSLFLYLFFGNALAAAREWEDGGEASSSPGNTT